ncbi:unnamed protein product [Vitrella brassicaformis CCMP3155]|uniref:Trimethylguanosine synthase n=1 Tax=Vitrella brassicaformis (strain CCMP3155) TaxID=1169540 RepID=A0A0G4F6G9_VITBC|nr:unnamed protein product [Vitrella brassicaformis CCMP3155]|eukprot:CEM07845.1 unnamed protein product [Vitrella brassicaformis CCMP3155]
MSVYSIDKEADHVELLEHNTKLYDVKPTLALPEDYESVVDRMDNYGFTADLAIIDPPWGGRRYLSQRTYNLAQMADGSLSMFDMVRVAATATKSFVTKIPKNTSILACPFDTITAAIMEGRATMSSCPDETISYDSDIVCVANTILWLALDNVYPEGMAYGSAFKAIEGVMEAVADGRLTTMEAVEKEHQEVSARLLRSNSSLTDATRPLARRAIDVYREVIIATAPPPREAPPEIAPPDEDDDSDEEDGRSSLPTFYIWSASGLRMEYLVEYVRELWGHLMRWIARPDHTHANLSTADDVEVPAMSIMDMFVMELVPTNLNRWSSSCLRR